MKVGLATLGLLHLALMGFGSFASSVAYALEPTATVKMQPPIIYMMVAKLQLPPNSEKPPISVSVSENGTVYVQETEISLEEVVPKLQAIAGPGYEDPIYVRGDKTADYGTVMKVMARISTAGYKNLGLVTLQEQDQ